MSDMTFTQAADEVRKLLRGLKAIDIVSSAMDRAGSVENAVKESEVKIASLRAEIVNVEGELASAVASVSAAKDDAKTIKSKAKDKADELIAKAEADAAAIKLASDKSVDDAKKTVGAANQKLQGIAQEVNAKLNELAELEANIANAKTQIAKLLGATT